MKKQIERPPNVECSLQYGDSGEAVDYRMGVFNKRGLIEVRAKRKNARQAESKYNAGTNTSTKLKHASKGNIVQLTLTPVQASRLIEQLAASLTKHFEECDEN